MPAAPTVKDARRRSSRLGIEEQRRRRTWPPTPAAHSAHLAPTRLDCDRSAQQCSERPAAAARVQEAGDGIQRQAARPPYDCEIAHQRRVAISAPHRPRLARRSQRGAPRARERCSASSQAPKRKPSAIISAPGTATVPAAASTAMSDGPARAHHRAPAPRCARARSGRGDQQQHAPATQQQRMRGQRSR